jgi:hypothetical protein
MRRRRTLWLLAVGCGLVTALVVWDRRRPVEPPRLVERLLPGFERARANMIEIERGGVKVALAHRDNGWWIDERRADDDAVESLLAVLEHGIVERKLAHAEPNARRTFGLDHPRVVVRVLGHRLAIGGDDPTRNVYVGRDDEAAVLVVEHRLVEVADLDPRLWPSRAFTVDDAGAARQIGVGPILLVRDRGWRLERPERVRASDAKVNTLVTTLVRARATHEVPANGNDNENANVNETGLVLDAKLQARLLGPCPNAPGEKLIARADGARLCFLSGDVALFTAPPGLFYERRVFPLRTDDVNAIDIGKISLRRQNAIWRIVAPKEAAGDASDERVRELLEPLLAVEWRSLSAADVTGGTDVRIASADDEVSARLAGGRARRKGESLTLELASDVTLPRDTSTLRR